MAHSKRSILPETTLMGKRRLTDHQLRQLQKKKTRMMTADDSELSKGLIISRSSNSALIETSSEVRIRASIRPDVTSLVAGDHVLWQPYPQNQGVVVSILPRNSVIMRRTHRGEEKAVAANVTQLMIVIAPTPLISWLLLDSYLVMAESLSLKACIVLNKTDKDIESIQTILKTVYVPLGYPIYFVSKFSVHNSESFYSALKGETSVFVGQSGVGKSSLISALLPEINTIVTSELSPHSNLGQHTTSNACLYHFPHGGALIDSPGIRELNFSDLHVRQIASHFREFRPLMANCQFRNCNHIKTQGCAIVRAKTEGLISELRYANYLALMHPS